MPSPVNALTTSYSKGRTDIPLIEQTIGDFFADMAQRQGRRDALCGICHQGWRYLCLFKGGKRRHLPGFIRPDDSLHKHHGGNCRVRFQHQAGIVWQRCLDQRRGEHLAIIATFLTSSGQG